MPSLLHRRLDRRTLPALLVAGALVLSAGVGGATAGALITGRDIADRSITSADIANHTIGRTQINTDALAHLGSRWNAGSGAPRGQGASTGTWYLDKATGDAYKKTASGWEFRVNILGSTGAPGAVGPQGTNGVAGGVGPVGPTGSTGPKGDVGPQGQVGPQGDVGLQGPIGTPGADAVSAYAEFFALAPPDNAVTVAVGTDVAFPQDGPSSGTITRFGPETITLPEIGTYRVSFSVPVSEAGQLMLTLDGADLAYTVAGRATGTSAIVGEALVQTTVAGSLLAVQNPAGNSTALTITPLAGGTRPVVATLIIEQVG